MELPPALPSALEGPAVGRRLMPSIDDIINYWREHHDEFPDLMSHGIGWGEPFCFGCGWLAPVLDGRPSSWRISGKWLDRAHLADRCEGGPDVPANLVMLCHLCHDVMPSFTERAAAVAWVQARLYRDDRWQLFTDGQFLDRTDKPVHRMTTLTRARLRWVEQMHHMQQKYGVALCPPITDMGER